MPSPLALLHEYPETDLVNYAENQGHRRRIEHLSPIPYTPRFNFSDDFIRAALAHAKEQRWNPIQYEIGDNPLIIDLDDIEGSTALVPSPATVPALPVLPSPASIKTLQRVNKSGNSVMCTASVVSDWPNLPESGVVLLKIFRDVTFDISKENHGTPVFFEHGLSRRLFEAEKAAYERLIHHGVVEAGVVPACYGWFPLSASIPGVTESSLLEWLLDESRDDQGPPRVLVFEFIPDAEHVSIHTASSEVAKDALAAL